jgi:hypothetical protein
MAKHILPVYLIKKLGILNETRADTEGAFATRCGCCVSESAESTKSLNDKYLKEYGYLNDKYLEKYGYLTASELEAIAYKLRFHSCEYHEKQKVAAQNPI